MPKVDVFEPIAVLLTSTATSRVSSSCRPWEYGWPIEKYRHSGEAAIHGEGGSSVTFSAEGMHSLEQAVEKLLRIQKFKNLYEDDDVWVLVASLAASVPLQGSDSRTHKLILARLHKLGNPPNSAVIFPIANVNTGAQLLSVGGLRIGLWSHSAFNEMRGQVLPRLDQRAPKPWWISEDQGAVVGCYVGPQQFGRAVRAAEELFDDVIALALMFEEDLESRSLFGLRGDSHRPGMHGLSVDREYLSELAKQVPALNRELGASIIAHSQFGTRVSLRWFAEPPFPLSELLSGDGRRTAVEQVALGKNGALRRLAVAARWHAKAYWSSNYDDAVLALGVCFDAMLSETGPSPGRVLAERFAFLAVDPEARRQRYKKFQSAIYPMRSAVAHGASRESVSMEVVRDTAREARATFCQLFSLIREFSITTEHQYNELFDRLKWGSSSNPSGA